ncbi:MAG: hypothetical protein AB4060_04240 [Crocosphaera sp.]
MKLPVKEIIRENFDDYVQKEKFLGTLELANKPAKKAISIGILAKVNLYLPSIWLYLRSFSKPQVSGIL